MNTNTQNPDNYCCSMAACEAARFLSKCDTSQVMSGLIQLDVFAFSNSNFLQIKYDPHCPFCIFHANNVDKYYEHICTEKH